MRLSFSRAIALVVALPVFVHAHVLLGFLVAEPIYRFGGLGTSVAGWLPGAPTIDPNVGGIDQALTMRAVDTLFSGALPWWNPFEGFGQPLAGEMQSSSLFPFSALLALPNGTLLIDVVLSILSGIGMLVLLRRLGLRDGAALVGAIAYEMCGTFSWLSGAWSYSIAWLPFLVLGIEYCRCAQRRDSRKGIVLVAVSIALLLSSGFIETAYLEGLTGVAWTIARLFGSDRFSRIRFMTSLVVGGSLGIALGSPIVIAFADTLASSYVGDHSGGYAGRAVVPWAMLQKIVPYVYGPIFASRQDALGYAWGNTGGYVGFALPALAIAGLFGRRGLTIRVVCALVVVFGFAAIFGGPLQPVLMLVPGVKYTAFYRYIDPSITFALCVLASLAIEDLLSNAGGLRWRVAFGAIAMIAITAATYPAAAPEISSVVAHASDADLFGWHWFSLAAVLAAILAFVLGAVVRNARIAAAIVGTAVCTEAVVFLFIPTLSYPSSATVSLGGVRYLQQHLGLQRFYSLGPIGPNYGSYFGIADLDYSDIPVPARTATYVQTKLDPITDPTLFFAGFPRLGLTQNENLGTNVDAFARVGVKYVLMSRNAPPPTPRLRARYHDAAMAIYELSNAKPYFSADGCTIVASSKTSATTTCRAPSTLCRLELYEPGWTVDVNEKRLTLSDCGDMFQSVPVPVGTANVEFRFLPPHMEIGLLLFAASLVIIVALSLTFLRLPKRTLATE